MKLLEIIFWAILRGKKLLGLRTILYLVLHLYTGCKKSLSPPHLIFQELKINNWNSGHAYTTQGGDFRYIIEIKKYP